MALHIPSNQNNILAYVEHRLEEWADWFSRGCDLGLGYPKQSTVAWLKENVGILTKAQGSKPLATHEQAEEMERLIVELALQNPRLARALRQQYLNNNNARQKARNMGLSYAHFKVQVDMAKQWLAGRLSIHV